MSEEELNDGTADVTAPQPEDASAKADDGVLKPAAPLPVEEDERDATAYQLDLPTFQGPLDLLLTLVLKEELDLADVEIAQIVLAFCERFALELEPSGEFLVLVDPRDAGPHLDFQQVPEPKGGKNRLHLDVRVPGGRAAIQSETDRLVALGATVVGPREERGEHWVVLQDPEGNEFCLTSG